MDKRKEIRNLIIAKIGHDPQDNFTILRYNGDRVEVKLWLKGVEEVLELKVGNQLKQKNYVKPKKPRSTSNNRRI